VKVDLANAPRADWALLKCATQDARASFCGTILATVRKGRMKLILTQGNRDQWIFKVLPSRLCLRMAPGNRWEFAGIETA
jgi:hypothetical protein